MGVREAAAPGREPPITGRPTSPARMGGQAEAGSKLGRNRDGVEGVLHVAHRVPHDIALAGLHLREGRGGRQVRRRRRLEVAVGEPRVENDPLPPRLLLDEEESDCSLSLSRHEANHSALQHPLDEVGVDALVAEGGVHVGLAEPELRPKSRRCSRRSSHVGRQVPGGVLGRESASQIDWYSSQGRPGHEVLVVGHDGGRRLAVHDGGTAELTEAPAGAKVCRASPDRHKAALQVAQAQLLHDRGRRG